MIKCDINHVDDDFVNYFRKNDKFEEISHDDSKYINCLEIIGLLDSLRNFSELSNKDEMYEFLDSYIGTRICSTINKEDAIYLNRFFELFQGFFDKLYHDVCYSEAAYINSDVYGEAYYSIDKDFILNKIYKNEYIEYADMYDLLLKVVPADYVDLIFEDFLYSLLHNSMLTYHRTVKDNNIHYQISYSSRIKTFAKIYLAEMLDKFGDEDITVEPDLKAYITDKLTDYNEYVKEEKAKQLKRC